MECRGAGVGGYAMAVVDEFAKVGLEGDNFVTLRDVTRVEDAVPVGMEDLAVGEVGFE